MTIMLLFAVFAAEPCDATERVVALARAAYDDAEVDDAAQIIEQAQEELGCQTAVVERDTLLELYRLRALVALAQGDDTAAIEATMRAVTVDPLAVPPASYGPELVDLHRRWAGRLSDQRVTVRARGGGTVYLDGLALRDGQRIAVLKGHHLIQIRGPKGLSSVVDVVDADRVVATGVPLPRPVEPPVPLPDGPPSEIRRSRGPTLRWLAGAGLVLTGAGVLTWANIRERAFHERRYTDWREVDRDAYRIRTLYATGYGLTGGGGLVLTANTWWFLRKKR